MQSLIRKRHRRAKRDIYLDVTPRQPTYLLNIPGERPIIDLDPADFKDFIMPTPNNPVNPKLGFCVKARRTDGSKVFINFLHCEEIPKPNEDFLPLKENEEDAQQFVRFPLSLGEPHPEKDKTGKYCLCFDIIINSEFYNIVTEDEEVHECVVTVSVEGINEKYKADIVPDNCMNLKNKMYHGKMPKHYIRTSPGFDSGNICPEPPLMQPLNTKYLVNESKPEDKKKDVKPEQIKNDPSLDQSISPQLLLMKPRKTKYRKCVKRSRGKNKIAAKPEQIKNDPSADQSKSPELSSMQVVKSKYLKSGKRSRGKKRHVKPEQIKNDVVNPEQIKNDIVKPEQIKNDPSPDQSMSPELSLLQDGKSKHVKSKKKSRGKKKDAVKPEEIKNDVVEPEQIKNDVMEPEQIKNDVVKPQQIKNDPSPDESMSPELSLMQDGKSKYMKSEEKSGGKKKDVGKPEQIKNDVVEPEEIMNDVVEPEQIKNDVVKPEKIKNDPSPDQSVSPELSLMQGVKSSKYMKSEKNSSVVEPEEIKNDVAKPEQIKNVPYPDQSMSPELSVMQVGNLKHMNTDVVKPEQIENDPAPDQNMSPEFSLMQVVKSKYMKSEKKSRGENKDVVKPEQIKNDPSFYQSMSPELSLMQVVKSNYLKSEKNLRCQKKDFAKPAQINNDPSPDKSVPAELPLKQAMKLEPLKSDKKSGVEEEYFVKPEPIKNNDVSPDKSMSAELPMMQPVESKFLQSEEIPENEKKDFMTQEPMQTQPLNLSVRPKEVRIKSICRLCDKRPPSMQDAEPKLVNGTTSTSLKIPITSKQGDLKQAQSKLQPYKSTNIKRKVAFPSLSTPPKQISEPRNPIGETDVPSIHCALFRFPANNPRNYIFEATLPYCSVVDTELKVFVTANRIIFKEKMCSYGFKIFLPETVAPEKCQANFGNKILTIVLPFATIVDITNLTE